MKISKKLIEEWRSEWFFLKRRVPLSKFMAEKGAEHAFKTAIKRRSIPGAT